MFESIYIGLTGLSSFSRNLTVIGNNVSNMNSAGFKNSDLSFADLVYRNVFAGTSAGGQGGLTQFGSGVGIDSTRVLFTQGDLTQTGNPSNLAVQGNGFFVLRDGDKTFYTRNGGFEFNPDGVLVSTANGMHVAAFSNGGLQDLSTTALRATPPRATSRVTLLDNLSTGDTTQDVAATVFDSGGASHALTITFTNNAATTPGSWLFTVKDTSGTLASGEVRFNGDGSPASGFNTFAFTLAPPGGVAPTQITLDFGAAGGFAGVTNFSAGADSTIRLGSQDGFAAGQIVSTAFDPDGTLVVSYSNGQTARGQKVALAFFQSPQQLEEQGGALFANPNDVPVTLGTAKSGVFGTLVGGSVEQANVDLAQQFSELIISQRGYQASSQVITTTNDMIDQLFQATGGKR
jgi:flagellar hook protein FlgE